MKVNKGTLKKVEDLYKALGYKVRYEKGQFQAGYCLVKQQGIVVINKFYTTDVRINTLLDILHKLEINEEEVELDDKMQEFWEEVKGEIQIDTGIIDTKDI